MNTGNDNSQEDYRAFLLLSEIEKTQELSQRDLAKRLGIALGLVNSYLKNLVAKGFVRVKAFPRNRYAYLLTPQGLAEKSRLAYQHLSYFTSLYTTTRQDFLSLFQSLKGQGVKGVAFCGVDEVAEIAFLSLQEAGLELVAALDKGGERKELFGRPVLPLAEGGVGATVNVVVTSLKRQEVLHKELRRLGVGEKFIHSVGKSH